MSEHEKALEEALGQLHDLAIGKDVDVKRSCVEIDINDVAMQRRKLGLSQQKFSEILGVSVDTIQNWEQGRREPSGPARALLNLIARNPNVLNQGTRPQPHAKRASATGSMKGHRHPVDIYIGDRVRRRRWVVGMTQQQLGDKVGIRFQQIQKYESGTNRISASRMWDIAAALEVPVSFFFEGIGGQASDTGETRGDILTDKELLDLVRAFYAIPENQRLRLFELARVLSEVA